MHTTRSCWCVHSVACMVHTAIPPRGNMLRNVKRCTRISLRTVMQKLVCMSLASARVTCTYQRRSCFCKGDTYLPKKGLAPPTCFTYKLEEGRVNTKTIKQLISEFHTRAEKEVTAHKACLLH